MVVHSHKEQFDCQGFRQFIIGTAHLNDDNRSIDYSYTLTLLELKTATRYHVGKKKKTLYKMEMQTASSVSWGYVREKSMHRIRGSTGGQTQAEATSWRHVLVTGVSIKPFQRFLCICRICIWGYDRVNGWTPKAGHRFRYFGLRKGFIFTKGLIDRWETILTDPASSRQAGEVSQQNFRWRTGSEQTWQVDIQGEHS